MLFIFPSAPKTKFRRPWRNPLPRGLRAPHAAMDVLDDDVDEEDETDVLKLAHAIAGIDRDTIRYNQELNTLTENFKVESEALEHVQDRVTSVTSELNAVLSGEQTETVSEVRQLGTRSAWSKFQNVAAWPRTQSTHTHARRAKAALLRAE